MTAKVAQFFFWFGLGLLAYAEAGYLALLALIARFRRTDAPVTEIEPDVTILIAAYNEATVIRAKLENTLALDYPSEKRQIIVVSDGATDRTDDIAREYAADGVMLHALPERLGKVPALRTAEPRITGEIVLFSDADSMYERDALRKLVRHFADPKVGAVSGHETRIASSATGRGKGEGLYVRLDNAIKRLEGQVGSQVMVNGGFFAARRALLPFIPDHLTHDGIVPASLHLQGYRTAYEPGARSTEVYALDSGADFARRIRTVLQAVQSYLYVKPALNPLRSGFYAIQIWSHRFLRWLVLPVLAVIAASGLLLTRPNFAGARAARFYRLASATQFLCYVLAFFGGLLDRRGKRPAVFYFPFYFLYVHAAAFVAVLQAVSGRRITTWRPTERAPGQPAQAHQSPGQEETAAGTSTARPLHPATETVTRERVRP
jgi:cellulose synthase/poly-beta-1,6-N-acetylglucosamine synthase-like glycosyltransferase